MRGLKTNLTARSFFPVHIFIQNPSRDLRTRSRSGAGVPAGDRLRPTPARDLTARTGVTIQRVGSPRKRKGGFLRNSVRGRGPSQACLAVTPTRAGAGQQCRARGESAMPIVANKSQFVIGLDTHAASHEFDVVDAVHGSVTSQE